jgi:hypothetical protein
VSRHEQAHADPHPRGSSAALAGINKAFLQQHIQIEIALAFDT